MSNVVITGSNRGLGLEFVKQLAKISNKFKIFALCRCPEKFSELQNVCTASSNVHIIKADMTEFDQYDDVVKNIHENIKSGGVNLLINNAGMMVKDTLNTVEKKNIAKSFEVNAMAPLLLTKALLPLMRNANYHELPMKIKKPVVLNISSQLGSIEENSSGDYLSYRISKAALNMATKSLAVELKADDVFVMALHPGWVRTDMGGNAAPLTADISVSRMLATLFDATETDRGCLLNTKGIRIPW